MLTGTYEHTIDAKGRVILPADLRAALGEHFFMTKGLEQCLSIYGENEWAELEQKLRKLPITDPNARSLVRHFSASGRPLECDRQGRFLVPANLRGYAGLEKEVVLTGMLNRVEVWSKSEWENCNTTETGELANLAAAYGI